MAQKKTFFESIGHYFTRAFLNGLLVILPFSLTIGLFILSARLIINWLKPVQEFIEKHRYTFPVLIDPKCETLDLFEVKGIPL